MLQASRAIDTILVTEGSSRIRLQALSHRRASSAREWMWERPAPGMPRAGRIKRE